jgi:DNA modification methylase
MTYTAPSARDERLRTELVDISRIKIRKRKLRKHPQWQIDKIIASIRLYGFNVPILIDTDAYIISGEARYEAALLFGLERIPAICISDLSPTEIRQFRIADNKVAEGGAWNFPELKVEFEDFRIEDPHFHFEDVGFSTAEADQVLNGGMDEEIDPADMSDLGPEKVAVSRLGDLFQVGRHRILNGDAERSDSYDTLMGDELADAVVTDPPYGIAVSSISGLGKIAHREFVQGSGIYGDDFHAFLKPKIAAMSARAKLGSAIFAFMDWRNIEILLAVGRELGLKLINLIVWNKMSGGMGSMYRSSHELLPVFVKPGAPHTNNVQLGRFGRNRRNVIDEPGFNSFGKERQQRLADHPTVKPVNLIAGLLLDASNRDEIVLDAFAGSGTILLAAEKTGRIARAIELDPLYVDLALRRFQERFGIEAIHVQTGLRFSELAARRAAERGDQQAVPAPPAIAPLPRRRHPLASIIGNAA